MDQKCTTLLWREATFGGGLNSLASLSFSWESLPNSSKLGLILLAERLTLPSHLSPPGACFLWLCAASSKAESEKSLSYLRGWGKEQITKTGFIAELNSAARELIEEVAEEGG